jgi:hypothetical protein
MDYLSESNILITLGSYWALVDVVSLAVMIIFRILNEEEVLLRKIPGYREYCGNVRYRLVSGMWGISRYLTLLVAITHASSLLLSGLWA